MFSTIQKIDMWRNFPLDVFKNTGYHNIGQWHLSLVTIPNKNKDAINSWKVFLCPVFYPCFVFLKVGSLVIEKETSMFLILSNIFIVQTLLWGDHIVVTVFDFCAGDQYVLLKMRPTVVRPSVFEGLRLKSRFGYWIWHESQSSGTLQPLPSTAW